MHASQDCCLIVIAMGALAGLAGNGAGADLDEGLIAHWTLDEGTGAVAHDYSGNGNHATIVGAAWTPALSGSGLEFTGTDLARYIPATFDDTVTDGLTVAAWVYWHGEHPGTYSPYSYVLDARTFWFNRNGGFIVYLYPNGQVVFHLISLSGELQSLVTTAAVPLDTWTHLAAVFDAQAAEMRVYVNSNPDDAAPASLPYSDTTHEAALGNNHWAPGDQQWAPLNGILDDVRVYRRALARAELFQLVQGGPDCNSNGILDECDVDCGEPFGTCDLPGCGQSLDCSMNLLPDECEPDCNTNGNPDSCDIVVGTSSDCNGNVVPDECEYGSDCNGNGTMDECDISLGTSDDCNHNFVPDECEPPADCNSNGRLDHCDIDLGASGDCNGNWTPDECDVSEGTSLDCNDNIIPDDCDLISGTSADCTRNGIPDECDIAAGTSADCNLNGIPDSCDIAAGTSQDCEPDGTPDECEPDCNTNGHADECDILFGTSLDCNANVIPDECETDCNTNGTPDDCDVVAGTSLDCNGNIVPDECEVDCNGNAVPDDCDVTSGTSADCNANGTPDDCDIWLGIALDHNFNWVPDGCETCPGGFGDANSDGLLTLTDYAALGTCLAGPGVPVGGVCRQSDLDDDCDVDLADFARFQELLGDGLAPGACCLPDGSCSDMPTWSGCVAGGGVFQGFGTSCVSADCWRFPRVEQVRSLADHAPGSLPPGEMGIPVAHLVESRDEGLHLLEITFSEPMQRWSCEHLWGFTGAAARLDTGRRVLRIDLGTPLPDGTCTVFHLEGALSADRRPLRPADCTFAFVALVGDVTGDRVVNGDDTSLIQQHYNEHVSEAQGNAYLDVVSNGSIQAADRSYVVARFGHSAPMCGD